MTVVEIRKRKYSSNRGATAHQNYSVASYTWPCASDTFYLPENQKKHGHVNIWSDFT